MKNLARLALFFSSVFFLSFLIISGIRFLYIWIDAVRAIPAHSVEPAVVFVASAKIALSTAIYCAALLSLSYTARRAMPAAFSIIFVFLFTTAFSFAFSLALGRLEAVESAASVSRKTLGDAGLRLRSGDVTIVITGDPADAASPRVVAMPDRPLIFQETSLPPASPLPQNTRPALPPAPFYSSNSWFMISLGLDFGIVSEQLFTRLRSGFFFFCVYLLSLALLLSSCRFVFELSSWPLANLFFGVLLFRGILGFEVFLNSEEIQSLISFFSGRLIPSGLISPTIYTGIALLVIVYTLLVATARGRRKGAI
ncbi:MAG: hypothetical protein LBI91_04425 [Spirochaetaceae bacterium]|nr:hypothetical protein [Spirochaetaceae bacterium]